MAAPRTIIPRALRAQKHPIQARALFNFYDLRFSTTLKYLPFKEKFLLSEVIIKCHYKQNERAYEKIKKNGRIIIGKSYLVGAELIRMCTHLYVSTY